MAWGGARSWTWRRWWPAMVVAPLVAAGLWVRLHSVATEPLWLDEAYSAYAADHGFAFLWGVVPRYETHPPFYYSLLRLWVLVAGDGVGALRAPGVVAGLATLALLPRLAWAAGGRLGLGDRARRIAAAGALAFASCAVPLVEMARQVRPYPLMILAYAVATGLLLRLEGRARAGAPLGRGLLAVYLLVLEALLWLHNLGPLYGVALTAGLACALGGRPLAPADRWRLLLGHLAVAIAYLPGLLILAGQAPTWAASTWLHLRAGEVIGHLQMLYAVTGWPMLAAALLAAGGVGVGRAAPGGWRVAALLAALALLPVALSLLLSVTVAPVFITRTLTPVAVPAILLYALGLGGLAGGRPVVRSAGWLAAGLLCVAGLIAGGQTRAAGPMERWDATVTWLARWARPGDVVLAYPNEGALPLAYALRDAGLALPIRAVPRIVPAFAEPGAWYPSGSRGVVSLTPARLRAIAAAPATRAVGTVWLLRLGPAIYDRGDAALHAFAAGRRIVRHWRAGAIDLVGLRRPAPPPPLRSPAAPARSPR